MIEFEFIDYLRKVNNYIAQFNQLPKPDAKSIIKISEDHYQSMPFGLFLYGALLHFEKFNHVQQKIIIDFGIIDLYKKQKSYSNEDNWFFHLLVLVDFKEKNQRLPNVKDKHFLIPIGLWSKKQFKQIDSLNSLQQHQLRSVLQLTN